MSVDVSGVDNLNSSSNGSTSLTGIKSAVDNLNAGKADVAGQVFTGNISAPNLSNTNTGDQTLPTDATLATSDITTNNVSTSKHGFVPKAPNDTTKALLGDGNWGAVVSVVTGSIVMYGGSSAPSGYLLCDGSAVSRTTNAALFAIIGTTFGSGDGSTTFNVPDMRGRVPVGAGTGTGGGSSGSGLPTGGSALTARARGDWLGEETHVLSSGEMPSHTHNVTVNAGTGVNTLGIQGNANNGSTGTLATSSAGSGSAHNNLQPVMTLNFIIKT